MRSIVKALSAMMQEVAWSMGDRSGFSLLEFDTASGGVEILGNYATVRGAVRASLADHVSHVSTCMADCGMQPTNVLRQFQCVVGRNGVERIIRFVARKTGQTEYAMRVTNAKGRRVVTAQPA